MAGALTHIPDAIAPLEETVVYDADVHLTYNDEIRRRVAGYMDEPWRSYVHPETGDAYPSAGRTKSLGGKRRFHILDVNDPEDISGPLCDGFGVDHPIINTSAPLDKVYKTEQAVAEMRGVNDMLLDRFLDENDDFRGLISMAMRAPHEAAEEIDRLGDEDGVVGVYLYQGEYQKPIGDPSHDPVWRAMEDNDLTPAYHISGMDRKAQVLREVEKTATWHALGPVWAGMLGVVSLITQGVPEKFPDLDFVILEGDITAVPLLIGRLNREWAQWRSEIPLVKQSPEQYIRDQFYFGTQPLAEFGDFEHMKKVVEIIGPENLLYASDHPHYDFDTPETLDRFLGQFSEEEREMVLRENAERAFGL